MREGRICQYPSSSLRIQVYLANSWQLVWVCNLYDFYLMEEKVYLRYHLSIGFGKHHELFRSQQLFYF